MYEKDACVTMVASCSALNNNLCARTTSDASVTWLAFANHERVCVAKLAKSNETHTKIVQHPTTAGNNITQVDWCEMGVTDGVCYLVACCVGSVNFYSAESHALLFSHPTTGTDLGGSEGCPSVLATGLASCDGKICVGTSSGHLLVFSSDTGLEGDIYLLQTLRVYSGAIYSMAGDRQCLVACDNSGVITVCVPAQHGLQTSRVIEGFGFPCTCAAVVCGRIVVGYGSGHLRVFSASTGVISVECSAHARWITALDAIVCSESAAEALVVSVGEDCRIKVWLLASDRLPDSRPLSHKFTAEMPDCRLMGVRFIRRGGASFAVATYDRKIIQIYTM